MKYYLILGSGSPRRREFLAHLKIPFVVRTSDIEEISDCKTPKDIACDVAKKKGRAVFEVTHKEFQTSDQFRPLVISADTIVVLGDKIYGKPKDKDDACKILKELEDKTHTVITAIYLICEDLETKEIKERLVAVETGVHFKKITDDILNLYLESGESLDKAGAYGIQGQALLFISHINGSYSNVVGFPLDNFVEELKSILGMPNDESGKWRELIHGA